jgi:hypothetical protein
VRHQVNGSAIEERTGNALANGKSPIESPCAAIQTLNFLTFLKVLLIGDVENSRKHRIRKRSLKGLRDENRLPSKIHQQYRFPLKVSPGDDLESKWSESARAELLQN